MSTTQREWWLDNARLSEIGLDSLQRARVLEWFARKFWVATEEGSGEPEYHSKSYDPLTIDLDSSGAGTAHSYVFDFHDGGRHHYFDSLDQLEDWLMEELVGRCEYLARESFQERDPASEPKED